KEFLEKADNLNKNVDKNRIPVTGNHIDPRVVYARREKKRISWGKGGLRVLLTTTGLGTNKDELEQCLRSLLPLLRRRKHFPVQVVYYDGTNLDHKRMVESIAAEDDAVGIGKPADTAARLRVLYADDLVEANMLLLQYGFPWADLVVAKPSG